MKKKILLLGLLLGLLAVMGFSALSETQVLTPGESISIYGDFSITYTFTPEATGLYSFTGTYPGDTYLDVYQGSTYVGGDHFYSSFNIFCTLEENTQYTVSFRDKYPAHVCMALMAAYV